MNAPQVSVQTSATNPSIVTIFGARVSYAAELNTPRAQESDAGTPSAPKYSCVVLFPSTSTEAKAAIDAVMWKLVSDKFGQNAAAIWQELGASNKLALRDGATKASKEGFMGNLFISPSAKQERPPKLYHKFLTPEGNVQELKRPQSVIYSGCYVNAQIGFWLQDNKFGRRVNAELLAVQFAEDGDAFGGSATADTSMFSGVAPAAPATAPMGFGAAPPAPPAPPAGFAPPPIPAGASPF